MDMFCPFPAVRNPATAWAEAHTRDWVRGWGLLPDLAAQEQFDAACFTELMGRAYPTVPPDLLALIADWNSWTFLVDTQLDEHELGRNPGRLGHLVGAVVAIMGDHPCPVEPGWPPLLHALAELITRLRSYVTPTWLGRFRDNVTATLVACIHEADYRRRGVLVDERLYLQMRPHTSGTACFLDLIELAAPAPLPNLLRAHPQVDRLVTLTVEAIYLVNDLASAPKERRQGDGNNLVLIAEREHRLDAEQAARYVYTRYLNVVSAFLHARTELPACAPHANQALSDYVAGLGHWMRANVDWSALTGRYQLALALNA